MAPTMNMSQMQAFHAAYSEVEEDPAVRFGLWDFIRLVGNGHIVCGLVEDDHGEVVDMFAVELMIKPIVHLCFLFFVGRMSRQIFDELFFWLWNALQHFKLGQQRPWTPGGVRIVGKPGWLKLLKQKGIAIDADGYIREDQEAVQHGIFRRIQ